MTKLFQLNSFLLRFLQHPSFRNFETWPGVPDLKIQKFWENWKMLNCLKLIAIVALQ